MIYYNRATEEYEYEENGQGGSMGRPEIEGSERLELEVLTPEQKENGLIAYINDVRQMSDYWAVHYQIFKDKVIVYEESDMGYSPGLPFENLQDAVNEANGWC